MTSLWQHARAQQPQQYALQTLPQHLRQAAHDHAMHASNTSNDDDESSGDESDVRSNQLDACDSLEASASMMRRKALLVHQEQHAAAALLQRRHVRETVSVATAVNGNGGASMAAVTHEEDEQQQHEDACVTRQIMLRQPPTRSALERKHSASKHYANFYCAIHS